MSNKWNEENSNNNGNDGSNTEDDDSNNNDDNRIEGEISLVLGSHQLKSHTRSISIIMSINIEHVDDKLK